MTIWCCACVCICVFLCNFWTRLRNCTKQSMDVMLLMGHRNLTLF